MGSYVFRRLLSAILVIFVVATATFILMHAIPGGPFKREKALPPAIQRNIEERYKLNDPLWKQYVDYIGNLIRGDLGPSYKYWADRSMTSFVKGSPSAPIWDW